MSSLLRHSNEPGDTPAPTASGTVNTVTSPVAHGANAWELASATAHVKWSLATVLDRHYFLREYLLLAGTPTTTESRVIDLIDVGTGNSRGSIRLLTDRTLRLFRADGVAAGPASVVLTVGVFYLVEMEFMVPTSGNGSLGFRLNQTVVQAPGAVTMPTGAVDEVRFGRNFIDPGINLTVDAVGANDDQGASDSTWLGSVAAPTPGIGGWPVAVTTHEDPEVEPPPEPEPGGEADPGPGSGGPGPVVVRLKVLDGRWEECGVDRMPGVLPESVDVGSGPWGFDSCRFQLQRNPELPQPDLSSWTPCEIEQGGTPIFSGRVQETPSEHAADTISVVGKGDHYDLDLDVIDRNWVRSRMDQGWVDIRSLLAADLSVFKASGYVEVGAGAIIMGWQNGAQADAGQHVGVTLDLGQEDAKRVVVKTEKFAGNAAFSFVVCGHATPSPSATTPEEVFVSTHEGLADGYHSGNFTTPRRYVSIYMLRDDGVSAVTGSDHLVRLLEVIVFRDTAFESGNVSVLTADKVIKDVMPFAIQLSQDTGDVAPTTFGIPDFYTQAPRTARELMDAANAFHGYRLKIQPDRRPLFAPQLTVPKYKVGSYGARTFQDASMGSAEEMYNRVVATAVGADGTQQRVERFASQQPGVAPIPVSSPAFPNPSFETDASGWTAAGSTIARSTTSPHSGTGKGVWGSVSGGDTLTTVLTGTFKRGKTYLATVRLRPDTAFQVAYFEIRLGKVGDRGVKILSRLSPGIGFTDYTVAWTPKADYTDAELQLYMGWYIGAAVTINVDTLELAVSAATALDRRDLVRTKVLEASSALPPAALEQLCDTYLRLHMRTPLRGTLTLRPGDVRDYRTGRDVHPRELVKDTGELIHFSNLLDPDTGSQGRDGVIAAVSSYDCQEEAAQVAIDNERDNFETLLARYAVVSGGG